MLIPARCIAFSCLTTYAKRRNGKIYKGYHAYRTAMRKTVSAEFFIVRHLASCHCTTIKCFHRTCDRFRSITSFHIPSIWKHYYLSPNNMKSSLIITAPLHTNCTIKPYSHFIIAGISLFFGAKKSSKQKPTGSNDCWLTN